MVTKEHNLGALILELVKRNLLVKVGRETSVIGPGTTVLQITRMLAGTSKVLKEAINDEVLMSINDASVIAAAIEERLRKM